MVQFLPVTDYVVDLKFMFSKAVMIKKVSSVSEQNSGEWIYASLDS